jgi:hypothetical protein
MAAHSTTKLWLTEVNPGRLASRRQKLMNSSQSGAAHPLLARQRRAGYDAKAQRAC